ncbi:type IV toxin-antitoxin system AbiEi family antitoxin domain-containing protein [Streptomyces sp. NPDC020719]|uniref:type IV toxin-antitoxin system AbiEi family antitoxin domain-containing protein n=1 Tax=Streptomyces sp. NPDC020719 TaxID=3154896 RepID=UPI0033DC5F77
MDHADALVRLASWTAGQWGLVTRAQAAQEGVDASRLTRLVQAGLLTAVADGVYQLAGAPEPRHADIKSAWLATDPGTPAWRRLPPARPAAVISHSSACRLHQLGDLPAPVVEMLAPPGTPGAGPGRRLHHGPVLDPGHIALVDGLPVTTPTRTITDLLHAGLDGAHIGAVIADAASRRLISPGTLAPHVQPFTHAYGLPLAATGHDLIDHLTAQAGERVSVEQVRRVLAQARAEDVAAALLRLPAPWREQLLRHLPHGADGN